MPRSIDDEIAFRSWLGARLAGAGWFVLLAGFLLALPILLGLSPAILVAIVLAAAAVAAGWVALRRALSERARRGQPGPQWLRTALILTATFGILAALPVYVLATVAETRPVVMPQVVLSNGTRTVTFQGMMHVGTEAFYKSVAYDLERAESDGYTMFFEGVQPSTEEADRWFSDTLAGGGDLSESYDALARTCGLRFQQDYFGFVAEAMEAEPDRYVTVDVTTAELRAEAGRLAAGDPAIAEALVAVADAGDATADAVDSFVAIQNSGTEGQKEIAGIVCRGVLSMVHGGGQTTPLGPLEPLIVDFRDEKLVDAILASADDRIFVTYGAGHLPGVIDLLQAADPAWEVESVKWIRAIGPPEEFEAELQAADSDAI